MIKLFLKKIKDNIGLFLALISIRVISNNEIKKQEYDEQTAILSQKIAIDIIDEFLKNI